MSVFFSLTAVQREINISARNVKGCGISFTYYEGDFTFIDIL